jgi:hypothetical protein
MYDFTRQNNRQIANLTRKVEDLEKRLSLIERNSGGSPAVSSVSTRSTLKLKKADAS